MRPSRIFNVACFFFFWEGDHLSQIKSIFIWIQLISHFLFTQSFQQHQFSFSQFSPSVDFETVRDLILKWVVLQLLSCWRIFLAIFFKHKKFAHGQKDNAKRDVEKKNQSLKIVCGFKAVSFMVNIFANFLRISRDTYKMLMQNFQNKCIGNFFFLFLQNIYTLLMYAFVANAFKFQWISQTDCRSFLCSLLSKQLEQR